MYNKKVLKFVSDHVRSISNSTTFSAVLTSCLSTNDFHLSSRIEDFFYIPPVVRQMNVLNDHPPRHLQSFQSENERVQIGTYGMQPVINNEMEAPPLKRRIES